MLVCIAFVLTQNTYEPYVLPVLEPQEIPQIQPLTIPQPQPEGILTLQNSLNFQVIQRIFNGLAQETENLQANIAICLDEPSAFTIVKSLNDTINRVANGDLVSILDTLTLFKRTISQFWQCLASNTEVSDILEDIHVKDISLNTIFLKFNKYSLTGNSEVLTQKASEIKTAFDQGRFEDVGSLLAQLLNIVLTYRSDGSIDLTPASFLEKVLLRKRL